MVAGGSSTAPDASPPMPAPFHVKRVTLTSKKNWWMVEMDQEENAIVSATFTPTDEAHHNYDPFSQAASYPQNGAFPQSAREDGGKASEMEPAASPIYRPPRHPTSIFSFPTPTAYAAPPNPTRVLQSFAHGSASEIFKCVVKKPDVVELEINGEMQSNASDVTIQFLAELRVYTTVRSHRNICAFLGCLENVGMVLEYIEGRTLFDVVVARPKLTRAQKIDYHNQLLDGLTHLHSYGLSHGDLSLMNVHVMHGSDTVKLLDFGRSVSALSIFRAPDAEPVDPFVYLSRRDAQTKYAPIELPSPHVEQIHPGTPPFSAPEVLRGECTDPLLADAFSFGMLIVCLDRCESVSIRSWDLKKDKLPENLFDGCDVFGARARQYTRRWNQGRRRLGKHDLMDAPMDDTPL
ncbi:kinase-like protein [Fistulina hepatica ATCC 64428]|uniref:Kinase-like protein n=1 Tax=Fistulina hepatica ATCC 64428 TaxID=1128425 RepID=A0A0D7A0K7_9AGAR|nr:kinase-like protein [Fistulina hepatica ATCC 64428]